MLRKGVIDAPVVLVLTAPEHAYLLLVAAFAAALLPPRQRRPLPCGRQRHRLCPDRWVAAWQSMAMANNPTEIAVPFPEAERLRLRILVGPCRVRIRPGGAGAWASGRYDDPTGLLPMNVTVDGGQLTLSQSTTMRSPSALTRAPVLDLE